MTTYAYFGYKAKQRKGSSCPSVFVFHCRASEISKWSQIKRSAEQEKGIQRILREGRAKGIAKYLSVSPKNIIPNNVLVGFDVGKAKFVKASVSIAKKGKKDMNNGLSDGHIVWGWLKFSVASGVPPALVVDGQHRLHGAQEYLKKSDEDIPFLVVALIESPVIEQAFQFIVVNNKAVRVPADNVKTIIAEVLDEKELRDRLLAAGIKYGNDTPMLKDVSDSDESPFKGLLKWDYNRGNEGFIQVTTIEQTIKYLAQKFELFFSDDEDSLQSCYYAIWRTIKTTYAEVFVDGSNFSHKVNLVAINQFAIDNLKILSLNRQCDILKDADVESSIRNLFKNIPVDYWKKQWPALQDNATMRGWIFEDLTAIIENVSCEKKWDNGLKMPRE